VNCQRHVESVERHAATAAVLHVGRSRQAPSTRDGDKREALFTWLVTTTKKKPACFSLWRLAAACRYSLKSSSRLGAKVRWSRNSGTTSTPSRSRNTAGLSPWLRLTISSACAARLDG